MNTDDGVIITIIFLTIGFFIIFGLATGDPPHPETCMRYTIVFDIDKWRSEEKGFYNFPKCEFEYNGKWLNKSQLEEAIYFDKIEHVK